MQLCILLLLLASAFGIRLYHIDRPPLDFSPVRQYQNAHIIRGLYYEGNDAIPQSKREIAKLNMERMGFVLEPRIIENAAVLGYRLSGGEHLWIPRAISALAWVSGGLFLFLTALRFFSFWTAIFAASYYLLLPYSILASRSIQPDSLMIMIMLASIFCVLRHDEKPSLLRLAVAGLVSAAAVLIKPYCVFMIFGVFFFLAVARKGFGGAVFGRDSIIYVLIVSLPTIAYYVRGLFSGTGFLKEHAQGSFLPHLLLDISFWRGWFEMIGQVVGYIVFVLAISGLVKIQAGKFRGLLLGLWAGFLFFGISATYQIHTHNYYSLPFIPIAALSMMPLIPALMPGNKGALSRRIAQTVISGGLVAILVCGAYLLGSQRSTLLAVMSEHKSELKKVAMYAGIDPQIIKVVRDDFDHTIRVAEEIGEHVGHSTNTLFLTPFYGRVLAYHGEFAGLPWPRQESLYGRELRGVRGPNIREDFQGNKVTLLYQGRFITYNPDYFIITDFDELERQKELKEYLSSHYMSRARTSNYLIYDLRKPVNPSTGEM